MYIWERFYTSFPMLLAGRIVSASAHGLFFSLASSLAVSLGSA